MAGPIQQSIYSDLQADFDPAYLVVTNESHRHNVPPGSESHFKVVVVSSLFENQRLVHRHQSINRTLAKQLAHEIHALAIHAYTPEDWSAKGGEAPLSPNCLGGEQT
ncbi:MAG: BolA/IbaG family iron-sulfur metabolism protein [Pseudomonadales bacterium]|jgi:BolA protein|nr:BolA/IbaG family iron-sulfur metabolism protein [Pseudomonadales bacterium]